MKDQNISEIYRLKKKENGLESELGTYFITFTTTTVPDYIDIGYLRVRVSIYTPPPMRCWNCLQFNHTKSHCKSQTRICGNCGDSFHLAEKEICLRAPKCVNCFGNHSSFNKNCPIFIKNKEINHIKVTEMVSFNEAKRLFRIRNPLFNQRNYAKVVSDASNQASSSNQPPKSKIQQTEKANDEIFKKPETTPSVPQKKNDEKLSEMDCDENMDTIDAEASAEQTENRQSRSRTRKHKTSPPRSSRSRSPTKRITRSKSRKNIEIKNLYATSQERKKYDK
jgi:hypothetical protein